MRASAKTSRESSPPGQLMPPFVRIFAHDGRVFGAPAALVFLMLLWSGLVIVTRLLARRLVRSDPEP